MAQSNEFNCQFDKNGNIPVTDEMHLAYREAGYVILRNFLTEVELDKLKQAAVSPALLSHSYGIPDGENGIAKMTLWQHPGNDFTGLLSRGEKLVNLTEALLEDEVYHYHAKLMQKEAGGGGAFQWHQDYGYCVFIAVDAMTRENGCLQLLEGSHKCGRIQHDFVGGQQGANMERVNQLKKKLKLVYAELQPGDCLLFHSNVLHYSAKNNSQSRRYALTIAYNTKHNDPVIEHHCPGYTPLKKVANKDVENCIEFNDMAGKAFINTAKDHTVKAVEIEK